MVLRILLLALVVSLAQACSQPAYIPAAKSNQFVVRCDYAGSRPIAPGTGVVSLYSESIMTESEIEEIAYLVGFAGQKYANFTGKGVSITKLSICLTTNMDGVDRAYFNPPKKNLLALYSNNTVYVNRDVLHHKGDLYHELAHHFNSGLGIPTSSEEDEQLAKAFEKYLSENHYGL